MGRLTLTGSDHQSVLTSEVIAGLAPTPGGFYLDATFGSGGHSRALLAAIGPHGRVLAMDRDPAALAAGYELMQQYPSRLTLIQAAFATVSHHLNRLGWAAIHGAIFDLGVSSRQLDQAERGFSFRFDGPLDMRMDQGSATTMTAAELLNTLDVQALADLFFRYGEEPKSRRMARFIVEERKKQPITTTLQLAELAQRAIPARGKRRHPATQIFQALRIEVNHELEQLKNGLTSAMDALAPGGRIAVISFHSLEDRIVKQTFHRAAKPLPLTGPDRLIPNREAKMAPLFQLITRKPMTPSSGELHSNPRSRSAKLRVIERLPATQWSKP